MADYPISPTYIKCGFFNSVETSPGEYDRVYSAEDMCMPYRRIISDGVFATDSSDNNPSDLKVVAGESGLTVVIQKGCGIFNHKWFELLTNQIVNVPENEDENGYDRIDSVVIAISAVSRDGSVIYRTGTPAEEPVPPIISTEGDLIEFRIANITVTNEAIEILDGNISDRRGIETPFVASLIQTLSTQQLFTQWDDLFNRYFIQKKAEVDEFIRTLTEDLTVEMQLDEIVHTTSIQTGTDEVALEDYDSQNDIIFVIVNGFLSTDYTINAAGTLITFTNELAAGTVVTARILKSVKAPIGPTLPQAEEASF